MSLKFYEAIKTFISDVEDFLTDSLKSVNLPRSVVNDKDELLKKLKALRTEFPQLNVETREKTPETQKAPERAAKVESQEIYDAIGDGAEPSLDGSKSLDSSKMSSSSSDVSEVPPALSAAILTISASMSGNLVRKNIGKAKVDFKNIFSSAYGKKYCLVSGGVFFFFDKISSKKASESFCLRGYEARVLAELSSKKEFCFELVCPGQKSYLLVASTQEEMDKWISALKVEALQIPDARLSIFCDAQSQNAEDEAGEEYEDPTPLGATSPAVPFTKSPHGSGATPARALPSKPPEPAEDDDFYDDVAAGAKQKPSVSSRDEGDEIYDDAESKIGSAAAEDDLLYEDYDEIQAAAAAAGGTNKSSKSSAAAPSLPDKKLETSDDSGEPRYDKMYYGKWDCKADSDNELPFKRGDIIYVISQEYDKFGWWVGCFKGTVGLVPREYLTPAYELICG